LAQSDRHAGWGSALAGGHSRYSQLEASESFIDVAQLSIVSFLIAQ
jgi:hypothetical protein